MTFLFSRLKVVISLLKMCEVALESAPQLATQWGAVYAEQYNARKGNVNISPLQCLSISTSTITIVFSIVSYIGKSRRRQWIHPRLPPAASLLPLGCITLVAVLSGTISFRLIVLADSGSGITVRRPEFWFAVLLNTGSMFFTIFAIVMPCHGACCNGRNCQIIRTLIHCCLGGFLPAVIIYTLATDYAYLDSKIDAYKIDDLFVFIMICLIIHFLLGIVIFSGLNYAKFFSPIIFAFVSLVRNVVNSRCGNYLCCRYEWQDAINEILDDVVKVESENQMRGVAEEKEQELDLGEEEQEQDIAEEGQEQDLGEEKQRLEFLMQPLETSARHVV